MPYQSINPATGELLASYPELSNSGLERAIANADSAYRTDWRHRSIDERAKIMAKAASILLERKQEYAQYLTLEMGKLIGEAYAEVEITAEILQYYAKNAKAYLAPKTLPESPNAKVLIEPIGVLLGIEPWNFPYYQVARIAGPQLMAGNVLLLKHAESVPQSALALASLFEVAGAPTGVYTNLFASIEQVGRIIEDPRVRGVTVTGSERAGAAVAERAGRALKKVVAEMGGSDPLIVLEDAPLEPTLDSALFGRMFNAGQCCVGSKRIIVVGQDRGKAFLNGFIKRMASFNAGDPMNPATTLAPLSSEKALNRLIDQIEQAQKGGARIRLGGKRINRPGYFLAPTVLTDINANNPIYTQELFGPVAAFYVVDTEEMAIELANATPFGLGASIFTADIEHGRTVATKIESGMVFVNQPAWTSPELPFGGVKNSGFGRELSERGFYEFVNEKLVNVAPSGAFPWGPVALN
ncbi:NAD-dependent succinate-semialdehyde dehydrogenase [Methylomonas methanica]|uniref:Succinate-semialdehyde dehydrogenase (NAD(P)(+)) n=1 Tax=Methylomonas methanica (strain DSM 25384 / MC09) TaxID=857087 RepID=F9ZW80_METMM|nr:NAD-dependent succinate-semialdehyde dehydrogenase [Methylomonas methanica]AEG02051.1 Succinate-semialdehyde dehydrogenase (NAD(P)(+)) [Methylomonas methanica MC09]